LCIKPGCPRFILSRPPRRQLWPDPCLKAGMVKIHCILGKKHRMIDKFVPANRSEQTRFGLVDEVVIGVIALSLLCFIGLIFIWVH
jgi:hypothetical protein